MKQLILSVDSPFKFFLYWLLLSLMCIDWRIALFDDISLDDGIYALAMAFFLTFFYFFHYLVRSSYSVPRAGSEILGRFQICDEAGIAGAGS